MSLCVLFLVFGERLEERMPSIRESRYFQNYTNIKCTAEVVLINKYKECSK